MYPWPQRPPGLIETAFDTLAARWKPILDAFDAAGVDLCFEIHPGEDLHDGASFEMFLARVGNHPRCKILYDPSHFVLQQLDYLGFIDLYHERIGAFHVKDAEFNPTARQGVYGGYQSWVDRAGRFRSLGDGQVDFRGIFSKLAQYGFDGWAVLEWECAIKSAEQGAREGAPFIRDHIIEVTGKAFDDFAATGTDDAANRRMLGLELSHATACVSAWSAAARAHSSAPCTASPHGWMTLIRWSAARCRPIPNGRATRVPSSVSIRRAATTPMPRCSPQSARAPMAWKWWRS